MRDMEKNPYSNDEKRVVEYLWEREIGGGDDPIGFILSSHAWLVAERKDVRLFLDDCIKKTEELVRLLKEIEAHIHR